MNKCKTFVERKRLMRYGVKVYDCDTQLRPTVETITPFYPAPFTGRTRLSLSGFSKFLPRDRVFRR